MMSDHPTTSARTAAPLDIADDRHPAGGISQPIPLRRLWWAAILLLGLSGGGVVWTIWQLRTDAILAAVADSGNIASVLAGQLSRSVKSIDTMLLTIEQSTTNRDLDTPAGFQATFDRLDFQRELIKYRASLPQVFNIAVADKEGRIVVSTAGWPTPSLTVSDRDYFINARTQNDGQLKNSIPASNKIDGRKAMVFARRLNAADGSFAGIVLASVGITYFESVYGAIQSVNSLLFTLLDPNGIILFRHPDDGDSTGKPLSNRSRWLDALQSGESGFRIFGQADSSMRFVSIRKVPEYPLIVDTSITESAALATWRHRASAIGIVSFVFLVFSLYLLRAVTRQVRSLSNSEASLAHKSRELERLARRDALTGLANRLLFMEMAKAAVQRLGHSGESFSILLLDIDQFKTVNDSLGHPAGDALLRAVAQRLRLTVAGSDCVARLGGDEFAILQTCRGDANENATILAKQILGAIREPYDLDGRKLILETSIGIALAPQDGRDADALIKNADLALYRAKASGRNRYFFFEASMEAEARERQELEHDLRRAVARNEFVLHYQPIVDLNQRRYCAAEALARWNHPVKGLVAPGQFISLAEETGLINPLGNWILRQACTEAVNWPPHIKIAVNLSPAQCKDANLLSEIKSALQDVGLSPNRLELEITESVLLENNQHNIAVLHELKKLGIAIVLDDFGIGYSSMTYLQMFPFDRIKIDRSFIQNMTNHASGAAIVCAIAGLGRYLDIATTAEGVETAEQLVFLRGAGCQSAQGYLFSRPVPACDLNFDPPEALRQDSKAA